MTLDYQEAIKDIDLILEHFKELENDGLRIAYEGEEKILEEAKNVMQEFQKQQEIISKNPDYLKSVKWMQNIIDNAQVCLDKMEQEAKKNPNIYYSPLLYEGRKSKTETIISCLKKLAIYEQIGTPEEVLEAVNRQNECKNCGYKIHSERISKLNNCNDCGLLNKCAKRPEYGDYCRINCYDWRKNE